MVCSKCGKVYKNGNGYCVNCGARMENIQPDVTSYPYDGSYYLGAATEGESVHRRKKLSKKLIAIFRLLWACY